MLSFSLQLLYQRYSTSTSGSAHIPFPKLRTAIHLLRQSGSKRSPGTLHVRHVHDASHSFSIPVLGLKNEPSFPCNNSVSEFVDPLTKKRRSSTEDNYPNEGIINCIKNNMWSCDVCTLSNPMKQRRCSACNARRSVLGGTLETTSSAVVMATTRHNSRDTSQSNNGVDNSSLDQDYHSNTTSTELTLPKKPIITNWIRNRKRKRDQQQLHKSNLTAEDDDVIKNQDDSLLYTSKLVATINGRDISVVLKHLDDDEDDTKTTDVAIDTDATISSSQSTPTNSETDTSPNVLRDESNKSTQNNLSSMPSSTTSTILHKPHDVMTSHTQESEPPNESSPTHFFYTPPLSLTMTTQLSQMDDSHDTSTLLVSSSSFHKSPQQLQPKPTFEERHDLDDEQHINLFHAPREAINAPLTKIPDTNHVPLRDPMVEESMVCLESIVDAAYEPTNTDMAPQSVSVVTEPDHSTIQNHKLQINSIEPFISRLTLHASANNNIKANGFQTAGCGNQIHISKEALQKAKNLLHQGHDHSILEDNLDKNADPSKVVTESHDDTTKRKSSDTFDLEAPYKSSRIVDGGFQTAGLGSRIQVTTEALRNANRILHDSNEIDSVIPPPSLTHSDKMPTDSKLFSVPPPRNSTIPSFHTAGCGNMIAVSSASLVRAAKLFDPSTKSKTMETPQNQDPLLREQDHLCVNSKTTTQNVAALHPSEQNTKLDSRYNGALPKGSSAKKIAPRVSFLSAGRGQEIKVSDECHAKAAKLLDLPCHDAYDQLPPSSSRSIATFQTAGKGNAIRVSDESLQKAVSLFQDATIFATEPLQLPPKLALCTKVSSVPIAFKTAGCGETINITNEGLVAARRILVDQQHLDAPLCHIVNKKADKLNENVNRHEWSSTRKDLLLDNKQQTHVAGLKPPSGSNTPVTTQLGYNFHSKEVSPDIIDTSMPDNKCGNKENVLRDSTNIKPPLLSAPMTRFQTAGTGMNVQVSEESLQTAAFLLKENNEIFWMEPNQITTAALDQHHIITGSIVQSDAITKNNMVGPQYTPATKNSCRMANFESEITDGYNNAVTPAVQESSSMSTKTETVICNSKQQKAPNSCRSSFSESSMVKGLTSSAEDVVSESPLACFETVQSSQIQSGSGGMSTPAQHIDGVPSRYVCKPYVTPGSSDGNSASLGFQALSLREAARNGLMVSNTSQSRQFGVRDVTLEIDSVNAILLRFNRGTALPQTLLVDQTRDTVELIGSLPDYRSELKLRKCDILKVCDAWLTNHIRWIIWKLASIERKFAPYLAERCLTFDAVAAQLQYRYDKEIALGARPALRRLLNRDVSASCMFILCVARIRLHETSQSGVDETGPAPRRDHAYLLELTDGWYALPAMPDKPLCDFIANGTIQVGTKLLISNSIMTGYDEGIDPLDHSFDSFSAEKSPVLHLSINSSRIARWDSKLGLVPLTAVNAQDGMLLTKKISDVFDCGGRIPLIDLRVVQIYPLSYLDLQTCSLGTKSRVLTEREERIRVEAYEKRRQSLIDGLYEEIQAECAKVRK